MANLMETHPNLIQEWDFECNILSPFDVSKGSNRKVWWIGKCGHRWKSVVASRARLNAGCPFCDGKKVCIDNCLATTHPELVKEWHPRNVLSPYEVVSGSEKKVWWQGSCGHLWIAAINKRAKKLTNCPICILSHGERKIREFLDKESIKFLCQYRFKNCKQKCALPFDFCIFRENRVYCVEFNGLQHYEPVSYFGGVAKFLKTIRRDAIKKKFCDDQNIPLLVIRYDQMDHIEAKLKEFLCLS